MVLHINVSWSWAIVFLVGSFPVVFEASLSLPHFIRSLNNQPMFTAHSEGLINICKFKCFVYFEHILPITLHFPLSTNALSLLKYWYIHILCVWFRIHIWENIQYLKSHIIGLRCCKWFIWNKLIFLSSNYWIHPPCSFTQRVIPTITTNIF